MQSFPACQALIPQLRKPGITVEQELARLQEEAKVYPERHRQLAALHYYLHFALWECQNRWHDVHAGITNYVTLLDEIERWRYEKKEQVCFVTFNYDTMLEEAMFQVLRLELQDMDSYHRSENYSLFKLHGSVNWGRVVENIDRPGMNPTSYYQLLIDTVKPGDSSITGRYHLCDVEMRPKPDTGVVLYPALSIPVENKDEFSCPFGHVTALEGMLPKVTKMITVGWRATEAEFLTKLKLSRTVPVAGIRQVLSMLVVSGSKEGTEETLKNLASYRGAYDPSRNVDKEVTTGFTGLISNLAILGNFLRTDLH
jgi:hypothetical protein